MATSRTYPRQIWRNAWLLLAVAGLTLGGAAQAVAPPTRDSALVTIRFNQPNIHYEPQLYGALEKAVAVKSEVTFDVISYAPTRADGQPDPQWQQIASQHTQAVVASLKNLGVPLSRLRISGQSIHGLKYDEVHVIPR